MTTNPLSKQGHVLRHQDSNLGILWGHKNSAHHRPASLLLVLSPEGRRGNGDSEKATGQLLVTEPAGSVAGPEPRARGNSEARRSLLRGAGRAGRRRGLGSRPANALRGCLSPRENTKRFLTPRQGLRSLTLHIPEPRELCPWFSGSPVWPDVRLLSHDHLVSVTTESRAQPVRKPREYSIFAMTANTHRPRRRGLV